MEREERDDAAAEQQPKPVLGVERDHHPADDDHDEEKDDEQADAQAKLLADHRKNKVGVRVGQVEHLLPALAEPEPFHPATAPGDQGLHLLQTGVVLKFLGIHESGESRHSLRHMGRDKEDPGEAAE